MRGAIAGLVQIYLLSCKLTTELLNQRQSAGNACRCIDPQVDGIAVGQRMQEFDQIRELPVTQLNWRQLIGIGYRTASPVILHDHKIPFIEIGT